MARSFNGSSDYLEVSSAEVTTVPLTIAAWVYPDNDTTAGTICSIEDSVSKDRHWLNINGNVAGDPIRVGTYNGATALADTSSGFTANQWNHAGGVWASDSSRKAYLNGGSSVEDTTSLTLSALDLTGVGRLYVAGSSTLYFPGDIAELGIWNAALTAAEMAILATGVSPTKVRPESLVAYYPLYGNASPEIDLMRGAGLTVTGATKADHPRIITPSASIIPFPSTAAGGTTYFQSVSGSLTSTGALTKKTQKALSGSTTTSGSITKAISRLLAGSVTNTGSVFKKTSKSFSGSSTPTGDLSAKSILTQAISGSITMSGAIAKKIGKSLSGSITSVGAITKKIGKLLSGSSTPSGSVNKKISRLLVGTATISGALAAGYITTQATSGSITMSGALSAIKGIAEFGRGLLMLLGVG